MSNYYRFSSPMAAAEHQRDQQRIILDVVIPAAQQDSAWATLRKVSADSPVDRGEYKAGWDVMVRRGADGHWDVRLLNDAPHAGIIELGARPFYPPIEPLIEWARRKAGSLAMAGVLNLSSNSFRVDAQGNLRYRGQASLDEADSEEVLRFAYAVQRAIGRRGLPPRYIMRKRLPYAVQQLDRAYRRHLAAQTAHRGPTNGR